MKGLTDSGVGLRVEGLEPGDRVDIAFREPDELLLPDSAWWLFDLLGNLEDEAGRELRFSASAATGQMKVRNLPHRLPELWSELALEYLGADRFRLRVVPAVTPAEEEPVTTARGVRVESNVADWDLLLQRDVPGGVRQFQLGLRAARLATHGGFERLICLPTLRDVELLDYQLRTAQTVLRRFRGRALLCDEVGLGKTIEAGLVFAELHLRGLARSILIVTPPSLVEQWQGEMRRKFALDCVSYDAPEFRGRGEKAWEEFPRIIVSLHTAKRDPHRSAILGRKWDLVIIDEAHHLRNRATQMWRFASQLEKQYILLLTATPVQNNLEELFNLVTLLEPGLLSTSKQFQRNFIDRRDKLTPRNVDQLHALLAEVMVRNRRSTTGLQFTRRYARTENVRPAAAEQLAYDEVTRFVRQRLRSERSHAGLNRMVLLSLQMAMGSSSRAAAATLRRLSQQAGRDADDRAQLTQLAEQVQSVTGHAKVDRLSQLLDEFPDKMVVFTQFRATQELLAEVVRERMEIAVFHGGLTRLEKEAAIQRFRGPARVLICTESGSEGRNLQFAHGVCNFDLPWNPMKIEQRIGRLSRIGQTRDVHVFNLVAAGTVEHAVLHLLEAKLNMFELVIGEIDMVLGNLEDDREFEDVVADVWSESADDDDFRARMELLGDRLVAAKEAWIQQRTHDDRIFGDRFAPDR